jgi:hypothetical protein
MHALDEVAIREIPLLQDDGVTGLLQSLSDRGGDAGVGAGAANE